MDETLARILNEASADPVVAAIAIGGSTLGLALAPILAWLGRRRRWARVAWMAMLVALATTLVVQVVVGRARPDLVVSTVAQPWFPSFPSGHVAIVAAIATVVGLSGRATAVWATASVWLLWVGGSRVVLGHHFVSDVVGGLIVGVAVGAFCHGWSQADTWFERLRWALFPQLALAALTAEVAWLGLLPNPGIHYPGMDKVGHFLIFGVLAFQIHLWLSGSAGQLSRTRVPWAALGLMAFAAVEEVAQVMSPNRSVELLDLAADALGIAVFTVLAELLLVRVRATVQERA